MRYSLLPSAYSSNYETRTNTPTSSPVSKPESVSRVSPPAPATYFISPAVSTPAGLCFYLCFCLGSGLLLLVLFFSTPAFANDGGTGSVPAIGFETPGGETGASTLVYALASLASSGQLQWDL